MALAPEHALRHFQKKARDALLRALDQEQNAILHPVQLAAGQREELPRDRSVAPGQRVDRAALDHEHFGVGDRLGGQRMLVGEFKTENIAGQIKSADLTAAVAEDFVGANAAADDLVKVVGRFVIAEDFGIARIGHHGAHQLHRLIERVGIDRAVVQMACNAALRCAYGDDGAADCIAAKCGLGLHGALPPGASGGYC